MNLIDAVVTEILSKPYPLYAHWWVDVKINAYGRETKTKLMFKSLPEAQALEVGKTVQI